MYNAYLYAIEIDDLAKQIFNEIILLKNNNSSAEFINTLDAIKTRLGLLAILITGSLGGNEEDTLINELLDEIKTIEHASSINNATLSNPDITYEHMNGKIKELIRHYQHEREALVGDENVAMEIINHFNSTTRINNLKSKKIKKFI